jgi:hypothetical protein
MPIAAAQHDQATGSSLPAQQSACAAQQQPHCADPGARSCKSWQSCEDQAMTSCIVTLSLVGGTVIAQEACLLLQATFLYHKAGV